MTILKIAVLAKRMKTWERRLMRDFQVAPVPSEEELQMDDAMSKESSLAKFKRIAKQVAQNTTTHKWGEVIRDVITNSQIGRCKTKDGNQQHLQKAMEQAKRSVSVVYRNHNGMRSRGVLTWDTFTYLT